MKELQILSPTDRTASYLSKAERISLGRSTAAELSFPDDNGLSRQHLVIERDGDGWALLDLGSKNGTMLNGAKVTGRDALKSGDRITAGHLILVYDGRRLAGPKSRWSSSIHDARARQKTSRRPPPS